MNNMHLEKKNWFNRFTIKPFTRFTTVVSETVVQKYEICYMFTYSFLTILETNEKSNFLN